MRRVSGRALLRVTPTKYASGGSLAAVVEVEGGDGAESGTRSGPAERAALGDRIPLVLLQRDEKETPAEVGLREVPDLDPNDIRRHTMPPFVSAG
jgi:hypothetical protein